jgi:hypothetical protein
MLWSVLSILFQGQTLAAHETTTTKNKQTNKQTTTTTTTKQQQQNETLQIRMFMHRRKAVEFGIISVRKVSKVCLCEILRISQALK